MARSADEIDDVSCGDWSAAIPSSKHVVVLTLVVVDGLQFVECSLLRRSCPPLSMPDGSLFVCVVCVSPNFCVEPFEKRVLCIVVGASNKSSPSFVRNRL